MTLYTTSGSLLNVSGSLANAEACCCDPCVDCLELPALDDCECYSADYTADTQPQVKLDVSGNIVIGGSYLCSVPTTQSVSTSFTLSCVSSGSFLALWSGEWVRDWQYCTYLVSGTTYRTYTMRAVINFSVSSSVPGTYNARVITSAFIGTVTHTGASPPANSCTGAWTPTSSASCPFIGTAPAGFRQEDAAVTLGTFDGDRYSSVDCPESCQEVIQLAACVTNTFPSWTNNSTEGDTVHTDNLTLTLTVL